jgi:serralysin
MAPDPDRHNRPRTPSRRRAVGPLAAVAAGILLALQAPLAAAFTDGGPAPWSPEEQQFVYELNRARWDPSAVLEAAGLPSGTVWPAPPLAVNDSLAGAGGYRSDEMADYDYFAHQSPITGFWPNAVARQFGYALPAFWPDEANSIESIHRGNPSISGVLASFVGSTGHRNHLMGQGWYATHREIGVGARLDARTWTVLTATTGSSDLFLTGVAYIDADGNGRMDLGEGLAGVTISAGTKATTSNAGGGWALMVAPGRYLVTATGGPFGAEAAVAVRVGRYNVEVDFASLAAETRSSEAIRPQVFSYQTCGGLTPTILGTGGDDVLTGTPGDDVIVGGAGNDVITGGGGDDTICGGAGRDRISAGLGRDFISGGPGQDRCTNGEVAKACESS